MSTPSSNTLVNTQEEVMIVGHNFYYAVCAIFCLEILAIFIVNPLAIFMIATSKKLHRSATNVFIASACIADSLYAASLVIFEAGFLASFNKPPSIGRGLCIRLAAMTGTMSMMGSLLTTQFIAIERAVATFRPLEYKNWITPKRAFITVFLTWGYLMVVVPTIVAEYYMTFNDYDKKILKILVQDIFPPGVFDYFIALHLYVPLLLSIIAYSSISVAIYKQGKRAAVLISDVGSSHNKTKAERAKQQSLKVTKMSMALLGLMLLTWSPYAITNMFIPPVDYRVHPDNFRILSMSSTLSIAFTSLYSFLNIILYAWNHRDYRTVFKQMFMRNSNKVAKIQDSVTEATLY